jgi:hypothetical protein
MVPSPRGHSPDERQADEWDAGRPDVRRVWGALDVAKVAVPVVVGSLLVSVPYALLVVWVTNGLLAWVDALGPSVTLGLVVFFTTTVFVSFLFSAVMLVDRLLPWESPLALEETPRRS